MKRLFRWISEVIKKMIFRMKLREMDFFVSYMGMSSWRLFPPSYYYRYTPEELEQMKRELREKIEIIFDKWDREEQEEKRKLE